MCKLCGTDRPPAKNPRDLLFYETVKDYLGEYSCTTCKVIWNAYNSRTTDKPLDHWILKRMFRTHYLTADDNYQQLKSYRLKTYNKDWMQTNKIVKMSLGITVLTCKNTGRAQYHSKVFNGSKSIFIGIYSSMDKALTAKIEYMVKNDLCHGLKRLKTKLKELQDGNN